MTLAQLYLKIHRCLGMEMVKYHGTPITPKESFEKFMIGRNALVSYAEPRDLFRAFFFCDKVIIDNGAFTIWRRGGSHDWEDFYKWLKPFHKRIEFFFIPDVIDGTEFENDQLIIDYKYRKINNPEMNGVPIWHLNESLERLNRLCDEFDYIAFGSSDKYSELRSLAWRIRMNNIMDIVCDDKGIPKVKIHMLRCLNSRIFTKYPFYSGDSTNLAQNHKTTSAKKILNHVEKYNSPLHYAPIHNGLNLDDWEID